jgi:hypothetical protein
MSRYQFSPNIPARLLPAAGTAIPIAPQFQLTIHTPDQTFAPGGSNDPTRDLIGYNFNKSLYANPLGSCTLYLNPGMQGGGSWAEAIPPMSLVDLRVKTPETNGYVTRFVGYAHTIHEQDAYQVGGTVDRVVVLECQDLMYGVVNAVLFIPGLLKQSIQSAPDTAKTYGPTFQTLANQIAAAEALSSEIDTNFIAEFFDSLLQHTSNQAGISFFVAPSTLIWMLMAKLLPIYFNPVSNYRGNGAGGIVKYTDLLTMALVASNLFQYSQTIFSPNISFDEQIQAIANPPIFEFFGDIRDAPTLTSEVTSDEFVTKAASGTPFVTESKSVAVTGQKLGPIPGDPTEGGTVSVLSGLNSAQLPGLSLDNGKSYYTVMFRNTPFSPSSWNSIPLHTLHGDYTQSDRSRTSQSVLNYFQVQSQAIIQTLGQQLGQYLIAAKYMPGLVDNPSVLQYGLGVLQPTLSILANTPQGISSDSSALNYLLWAWYRRSPQFWQGTIVVPGSPHIRVGQRVFIESWGIEAYVEGVQDSWSVTPNDGEAFSTQITFSRGMDAATKEGVQQDYQAAYSLAF